MNPSPAPPRSASPASSSRPSSPNFFLSQSTSTPLGRSGRLANPANATLNLSLLLGDLETLHANPGLLESDAFKVGSTPGSDLSRVEPEVKASIEDRTFDRQRLTRDDAARFAHEWLTRMDTVLTHSDRLLEERSNEGARGRMDQVENWVASVERGLEQAPR